MFGSIFGFFRRRNKENQSFCESPKKGIKNVAVDSWTNDSRRYCLILLFKDISFYLLIGPTPMEICDIKSTRLWTFAFWKFIVLFQTFLIPFNQFKNHQYVFFMLKFKNMCINGQKMNGTTLFVQWKISEPMRKFSIKTRETENIKIFSCYFLMNSVHHLKRRIVKFNLLRLNKMLEF